MSKFCGNCGAELDDNAKVCGYCGVTLSSDPVRAAKSSVPGIVTEMDQQKAEKMKQYIKMGAAAVAAVLVLVIGISVISSSTGYKGALKKAVKYFSKGDSTKLYSYASEYYENYYEDGWFYDDFEDFIDHFVDVSIEEVEDRVGRDPKVKYKITDSYKLEKRKSKLEDITDLLDDYDVDYDVKSIRMVEVEFTIKGSKKSITESLDLVMLKENGKWKFLFNY